MQLASHTPIAVTPPANAVNSTPAGKLASSMRTV